MDNNRKFPSSAHAGGPTRIQGFEAFGQVFPMWGTTPFYRPFEFAVPLPIVAATDQMARLDTEADTVIEGIGAFFADANKAYESAILLEINGATQPLPTLSVPLFVIGNGFQALFPLNLFMKKNSVFRVRANSWNQQQDEVTRFGVVILKGWTFA